MRSLSIPLCLLLLLAGERPARGQDRVQNDDQSPFEVWLEVDIPVTLSAALLSGLAWLFLGDLSTASCLPDCDPETVNALDRTVIGRYSDSASLAADILATGNLILPHLLGLADLWLHEADDGFEGYGKDALVLLETAAVAELFTTVVKYLIRRPRPYAYDGDLDLETRSERDSGLSFFSAHTCLSFAMATAYGYLLHERHPNSDWVVPAWMGLYTLAAATGYLRIVSGRHFWSDVLVGAAAGIGIGLSIPYLHMSEGREDPATRPDALQADGIAAPHLPSGQNLTIVPIAFEGGAGLLLTIQ